MWAMGDVPVVVLLPAWFLNVEVPPCEASEEPTKDLSKEKHTMALSQSALLEVLDALKASDRGQSG